MKILLLLTGFIPINYYCKYEKKSIHFKILKCKILIIVVPSCSQSHIFLMLDIRNN